MIEYNTDMRMYRVESMKDGDPQLQNLITNFAVSRVALLPSVVKLEFIDCAKRLFGNFDKFVEYNIENNNLIHGIDLDFLIDTVEFVNGGIRSLPIETWGNYIEHTPKKPDDLAQHKNLTLNYTGTNYIGKWLRQPNGMADLISTLIIMFGLKLTDPKNVKNGLI